ncbi:MAG: molybdopterin cofactor-binding domain-containing protein [Planctomycetota bacterium]
MSASPTAGTTGMSRRFFLAGVSAGSLVLAARISGASTLARILQDEDIDALTFEPDVFVSIAPDGIVTIVAHRSEMGTGIRTALPMVVADELGADWERVSIDQAIGDSTYGSQNTDGSRSVRRFYQRMRIAGATARTMLERAAAAQWDVEAADCVGRDHRVTHMPTGRTVAYGELVDVARELDVPEEDDLVFKPKSERKYVGTNVAIADLDGIVNGNAQFGMDIRRPNMVFAVVERSPVLGGAPTGFNADDVRSMAGIVDVVELPTFSPPHAFQALGGIAVVASSTWAALEGRKALRVTWSPSDHASYDSTSYEQSLLDAARSEGQVARTQGDAKSTLDAADASSCHEADYYVPTLAHASMEPPCAVAELTFDDDGAVTACEVWAPTQNPQAAQGQLASSLELPPDAITVHVTLLGGGFGRKSKPDFIVEAALLARDLKRPVQVVWTREDDIRHDYFHSVAACHVRAAVDDDGMPTALIQRSAFPTIGSSFNPTARYGQSFELGLGFTDMPYDVPNLQVENGPAEAHLRIGWLRSVAHIFHAFAVCSFPDELAHRAGRDPYEYLMSLLGAPRHVELPGVEYANHGEPLERYPIDVGRLRAVTERVAQHADWGRTMPRGRGLGIACHRSFLSYCANVIEVDVAPDGTVRIPNVWVSIDAGTVIHPDRVRAQMEGSAVFGASLAMYGEITATNGVVDQSNFHDYRMARIYDAPQMVHVDIVESDELPAGVGEVGVPPFAPALCNAIYAATGHRIRRLPIMHHDLSWNA